MPGRLRQGSGVSDKAQNCCNKCCNAVCRMSPWNKVMCYALIALSLGTVALFAVGGFASYAGETGDSICSRDNAGSGAGLQNTRDPEIPVVRINAFVWWLSNAGIFSMIMIIMTCCCCFSYITLCCGFSFPVKVKIVGIVGFVLLIIALGLFIIWVGLGSYLIGLFGVQALFSSLCRKIVAYVVVMYVYLLIFFGTVFAAVLFSIFGHKEDKSKKGRSNAESKLKLPPTKLLTAMV